MSNARLAEISDAYEPALIAEAAAHPVAESGRLWRPRQVMITPDAHALPFGRAMLDRAEALGAKVIRLKANRLSGFAAETPGKSYALAKSTLAIVVSPPGARKLQPIPPSADWQFHLAQGCPAHCQYCYLAGSLSGPPVTRVYANVADILDGLTPYSGQGTITSRSPNRAQEGTTFEVSCYTDPLGIEHITQALAAAVRFFGEWEAPVQLRWTTKFDGVQPLLALPHGGRTRVRFSINAASVSRDFEGGTASVARRLGALRLMAQAGYPVGLTIAPIMPVQGWREEYRQLFSDVAESLEGIPGVDLSAELITHRFTPGSKEVLLGWYPKSTLDLREEGRTQKRTKFGGFKYVYPKESMADMRSWMEEALRELLPGARVLYFT